MFDASLKNPTLFKNFLPDLTAGVSINAGDAVPADGWATWIGSQNNGQHAIFCNGSRVGYVGGNYIDYGGSIFPVCKGDILTDCHDIIFYPLKG